MVIGSTLVFLAMLIQASGKVLYGTLLTSVPTPIFVAIGITLTAAVFLALVRLGLPRQGRGTLLLLNLWTAISFVSFFYALKHVPPAIFASIEIGTGLLTAVALVGIQHRAWPNAARVFACLGIVAGCAVLTLAEMSASALESAALAWSAIGASAIAGATSVLSLGASRKLAMIGWTSRATLAHRFYLTIAVGLLWLALDPPTATVPDSAALGWILLVATLVIVVPLLLYQLAVRQIDEITFMVCVATQPILSFIVSMPSPAYEWNMLTLVGVLIVSAFFVFDVVAQNDVRLPSMLRGMVRRSTPASPAPPAAWQSVRAAPSILSRSRRMWVRKNSAASSRRGNSFGRRRPPLRYGRRRNLGHSLPAS